MIKVQINKICAKLVECEPLTAGMIGKTLEVEFSADWAAYTKTAVFSNGDTTIDVLESQWDGNTITIPAEVLAVPSRTVLFGVYGFAVENGTTVAIPTIYARIGIPMVGADPESDPTTNPSLPVYAQLQWEIDHFEISDEQIAEQVQQYLAEHPIEIQPATANVLGGVKVGDGLSVTSDGTLSADVTTDDLDELVNIVDGKQDEIADLDTIRAGATAGATAVQPEAGKGLFSGNYNDLTNKPTIPAVNDGVLTIKQGGVTKGTFSANASSATEINLDAGGGGDNTLVITVWLSDYGTPGVIIGTPSTTHAEIIDAIENEKDITLVAQIDDSSTRYNFDIARSDGDYFPVVFCGLIPPNDDYWGEHTAVYISVSPSDVWSISYDDYALKSDIGELTDLDTTDKSNIVAAINEVAAGGGAGKPYHVGTNPPSNTNLFWINTQDEVEVSLSNGVLTFVGVDPVTDIELVGAELRMR